MRPSPTVRLTIDFLVVLCAATAPAVQAQSAPPPSASIQSDRLSLAQYFDFEDVSAPQLSRDGRQVIYTRRHIDKLNDRWESELWMVNTVGMRNRFLVKGSAFANAIKNAWRAPIPTTS